MFDKLVENTIHLDLANIYYTIKSDLYPYLHIEF
jgi:hypothetical protein